MVRGMVTFDDVQAEHVQAAMKEYDELGGDAFLRRYGLAHSRDYLIWDRGASYDSKAILGVALSHAEGKEPSRAVSNGEVTGAAQVLTDLGFTVIPIAASSQLSERPDGGEWREATDGLLQNYIGADEGKYAVTDAARDGDRRYLLAKRVTPSLLETYL